MFWGKYVVLLFPCRYAIYRVSYDSSRLVDAKFIGFIKVGNCKCLYSMRSDCKSARTVELLGGTNKSNRLTSATTYGTTRSESTIVEIGMTCTISTVM